MSRTTRARRRATLSLRRSINSVIESLETRCLLTGTATAAVPWEGASTLSTEDYNPATVSVFAEAAAFEEQQQSGWFRFHRSYSFNCGCGCGGGLDSPLTVDYEIDPSSTATPTDDYYPLSGHVDFYPGESDAYVYLQPNDDHVVEDTESVRLNVLDDHPDQYVPDPVYWYSTGYIIDNEPTVSITATDTADEQGATTGKFTITRTTEMYAALDVDLLIGGTASPDTDYTLTDADTGQPIAGSVTIPEGEYSTDVIVTPIDDSTPEWTETVTATLAPGDPAAFRLGQSSAVEEITDNDLGLSIQGATTGPDGNPVINLNNDDDDGDGTADLEQSSSSGGDDDLAPLSIDYPQDVKYGATVTLSGDTSKLKVWADASKSQLIIGDDQTSHTWIIGQDTIPSQMVVEGVAGSEELADASLTLMDSDSPATPPPTRPTSNQTTRPVTIRFIHIFWRDPLHPDDGFKDWAGIGVKGNGQPLKVIVGEDMTLTAQSGPPELFPPQSQHQWDIPGQNIGNYSANNETAAVTPTRTDGPIVDFHWLDGGDPNNVNQGVKRVVTYTSNGWRQQVGFEVLRPTAHVDATGSPTIVGEQDPAPDGSITGLLELEPGMKFERKETAIPAGFAGDFFWVQLIWGGRRVRTVDGVYHLLTTPTSVDTTYPYSRNAGTGDGPRLVGSSATFNYMMADETFQTYLMFQPQLAGSIPVPVRKVDWFWGGTAEWNGTHWVGDGFSQTQPAAEDTTAPPVWDANSTSFRYDPPIN